MNLMAQSVRFSVHLETQKRKKPTYPEKQPHTSYFSQRYAKRIADMAGYSPPPGSVLYQDTGFQGFTCGVKIMQPTETERARLDASRKSEESRDFVYTHTR